MTTTARMRALVAVADTGSVRSAATRLVVTVSAVSAAVAALTRDIGVPLVEREGRGVRLTTSGRSYAGYARTILALHDEATTAARGDLDPEHGRVRIAAVPTAAEHVLLDPLATFRDAYPGVEVRLEVGTSERVWDMLATHDVDLVVGGRPPRELDAVSRANRPNALVVVGAAGRRGAFDPARATWLMRETGSGTRATCEALLAGLELEPPRLTLGSNGAVVAGAVAGLGVTLASRDAVARAIEADELVELAIPGTPLRRPWHAVTRPRTSASTLLLVGHLLGSHSPAGALLWHRARPRRPSPRGSTSGGR